MFQQKTHLKHFNQIEPEFCVSFFSQKQFYCKIVYVKAYHADHFTTTTTAQLELNEIFVNCSFIVLKRICKQNVIPGTGNYIE